MHLTIFKPVQGGLVWAILLLCGRAGYAQSVEVPPQVEAIGQTRLRLNRAYDRLCAPPLDNVEFVLADVSLRMDRRFTHYSGDISGRMLGALNATEPVLGRTSPAVAKLIARFPQYQKPDGHFGTEQDLDHLVQIRDMPILWGNGRLLLALAERCRTHPDPVLLAVAKRLGEYILSTRPYYGKKENFQHVGGVAASGYTTCYPSMIDGLVALGQVTGQKRFHDEARFIARLSLLDKQFHRHHSHGRLVAYRGMLDLDRLTGTREFVGAVRAGCERISQDYLFPTGGVPEYFDRAYGRDEGCSEADWIRVNFLLWRATGDTAYLDAAECALGNHMFPMQFSNGGFGHGIFRTLHQGERSYPWGAVTHVGSDSYWCCSMHCTQVLSDAACWAILGSGEDILVTWLAEARATMERGDHPLVISARHTSSNTWEVSVEVSSPTQTTLRLRVPGWAHTLTVDGKPFDAKEGWVDVTRKWSGTTTLRVTFPDKIRLAGPYAAEVKRGEPVRLFAGADLFCLPAAFLREGFLGENDVPTVVLAAQRPINGEIPVVLEGKAGKRQKITLVPISGRPRGGAHYLFNIRRVGAADFARLAASAASPRDPGAFVEMEFACDGTCDIYLNGQHLHRQNSWQDGPRIQVFSDHRANVVAILASSKAKRPGLIGVVRAGGRTYVTQTTDWSVVPAPQDLNAGWLTDPKIESADAGKLVDIGALGVPPWNYVPGGFLGTGARWVWPQTQTPNAKQKWLFRFRFDLK